MERIASNAAARSRRWFASNFMRPSAQAPHEMRADRVRHRHRQALPQRDEGAVFRVERIVLRDARAAVEAVLVGERRGLEAPVALEVEGRSEEHTSELQSHSFISYAVFCL